MSTLRAELIARARGGDLEALSWIIESLPATLPAGVRRRIRDQRLRKLGFWLSSELPGSSAHCIAALLAAAGRRIEAGRGIGDAPPFDTLLADERAQLAAEIHEILRWSPAWPGLRQLVRVLTKDAVAVTARPGRSSADEHSPDEDQADRRTQRDARRAS